MAQATVGSNPTPTAIMDRDKRLEWTKAAVLSFDKGRYGVSHRGFESYSHRHYG